MTQRVWAGERVAWANEKHSWCAFGNCSRPVGGKPSAHGREPLSQLGNDFSGSSWSQRTLSESCGALEPKSQRTPDLESSMAPVLGFGRKPPQSWKKTHSTWFEPQVAVRQMSKPIMHHAASKKKNTKTHNATLTQKKKKKTNIWINRKTKLNWAIAGLGLANALQPHSNLRRIQAQRKAVCQWWQKNKMKTKTECVCVTFNFNHVNWECVVSHKALKRDQVLLLTTLNDFKHKWECFSLQARMLVHIHALRSYSKDNLMANERIRTFGGRFRHEPRGQTCFKLLLLQWDQCVYME